MTDRDRPKQERDVFKPIRPFQSTAVTPPEDSLWLERFRTWAQMEPNKPLDLEIGCGVGWHPIRYARSHPERRLVAIERTRDKFEKFRSRVERNRPLDHLFPVHADAIRWVTHAISSSSIERCLVLYPNPEPKAPNKRWIRMPFMRRLLHVLKPGGEILIATNERWYWEEVLEFARRDWSLVIAEERVFAHETRPPGLPRTHFEKKYLLRGETCFDVRLRKP